MEVEGEEGQRRHLSCDPQICSLPLGGILKKEIDKKLISIS